MKSFLTILFALTLLTFSQAQDTPYRPLKSDSICTNYGKGHLNLKRRTLRLKSDNKSLFNSDTNLVHTILLDFDGYFLPQNHSWNDNDSVTVQASYFTPNEIDQIFQRVADDFSPFQVNITTNEKWFNQAPKAKRMRVVITPSHEWYPERVGGVAYLHSYTNHKDIPCWVFESQLGYDPKNTAEAASHEIGHTLGLSHDGNSDEEYYSGHNSWGPIMGLGYSSAVSQFSKGEYTDANNSEDDLAIIERLIPLKADLHGDSLSAASPLSFLVENGNANLNRSINKGVIQSASDEDYFSFSTSGGTVDLNIKPIFDFANNLHFQASLLDNQGNIVLSEYTSIFSISEGVSLSTTLPSGDYFLKIEGIGNGTPQNGFSDYNSMGNYLISGTIESVEYVTGTTIDIISTQSAYLNCGSYDSRILVQNTGSTIINSIGIEIYQETTFIENRVLHADSLLPGESRNYNLLHLAIDTGVSSLFYHITSINNAPFQGNSVTETARFSYGEKYEMLTNVLEDRWNKSFEWELSNDMGIITTNSDSISYAYNTNSYRVTEFCLAPNTCYDFEISNPFMESDSDFWPQFSSDSTYTDQDLFEFGDSLYFPLITVTNKPPNQYPMYYANLGVCPPFDEEISIKKHANDSTYFSILESTYDDSQNPTNICFDITTNTSALSDNSLKIYPNPVDDNLIVAGNSIGQSRYIIFSINGQVIQSGKLDKTETMIKTAHLISGFYIISILSEEGSVFYQEKLVKK